MRAHARSAIAVICGITVGLLAGPVAAQSELGPNQGFGDRPRIGLGYVSNAPNMFAGASGYFLSNVLGGLGLYLDGKMSTESPADDASYVPGLTMEEVEALPNQEDQELDGYGWWSVNAAIVRPITPEFMVYLGAGYTHETAYHRFRDAEGELEDAPTGLYWVRNEGATGGRVNYLGGAFFRMTRHVAFQFGLESQPGGFTVGASYSFPLR